MKKNLFISIVKSPSDDAPIRAYLKSGASIGKLMFESEIPFHNRSASQDLEVATILKSLLSEDAIVSDWLVASGYNPKIKYSQLEIDEELLIPLPSSEVLIDPKVPDLFDLLKSLNDHLENLAQYIDGINDPMRKDTAIVTVRAYIKSAIAFLESSDGLQPDGVPIQITKGLSRRLREIDWEKQSKTAGACANAILKILDVINKLTGGGS